MRHMLDTDTCVAMIRRRPEGLLRRLVAREPGTVGISAITVSEMAFGVEKSRDRARNHDALLRFLLPLTVAPFDERAAHAYGGVRASLEAAGRSIGAMDLLIAAHALALGSVLVTHNTREFARVQGLTLEDWLDGQ